MKKNKKIKILAFTSGRSDYDLLSYLFQMLTRDPAIDFRLIVSNAHLSPAHGMTVKYIEQDGLKILDKIETLLDSDSDGGRIKSASLLLQNAIHCVERFSPDLIIYAGDREDVMVAALIGGYLKIPTAHFFAGDHDRDGSIDNPLRHATSKLSAFTFASMPEHRRRLMALRNNPTRIFTIGSCALDKFRQEPRISRRKLFSAFVSDGRVFDKYALVIFHALMAYEHEAVGDFRNIITALAHKGIPAVVNVPNIDPGSRRLMAAMQALKEAKDLIFVSNLSRNVFVNLYRHAAFQIGNSSCGLVEAASIPIGVVNVGRRMEGKKSSGNVIFVDGQLKNIEKAIGRVTSHSFYEARVKGIKNIYGDGRSSIRALSILKNLPLKDFAQFRKEDPLGNVGR
jgi:UDP-N-acetylglucosamine 2-epimerase (non-hydrolysing)/GDP/UDP-N,N'-diacetylbacillosamine 2-epimerase (hydrolysing)